MADQTIKELAEELGVSKQRIQQIIAKLPTSKTPNKVGNKFVLNEKNIYDIKVLMGLEVDNFSTSESKNRVVDYDIYLDVLNSSKEKDEQLKLMQKLLDQQQQLALQSNQQIELLQKKLTHLKEPTQETSEESAPEKVSISPEENRSFWRRLFKF